LQSLPEGACSWHGGDKGSSRGYRAYLKEPVAGMEETNDPARVCRAYLKEPVASMEETKDPPEVTEPT
jgi:hypothetical protein